MINYTPPPGAEWLANAVVFYVDLIGKGLDRLSNLGSSDDFKSAEDVRAYARSIRKSEPNLADDLIAAANRHDGMV
jgi:hypothetical protein